MFRRPSMPRRALACAAVMSAAALAAASPISAKSVTDSWPGRCWFTAPSKTVSMNVSFAFSATIPDRVRPGASFAASGVRLTATIPAESVKELAGLGSGVQWKSYGLTLRADASTTPAYYNVLGSSSALSTRQPFQIDQLNVFDGTKTTYKALSLEFAPPTVTNALSATGGVKTVLSIDHAMNGQLLVDQLFGQAAFTTFCIVNSGTPNSGQLGTVQIGNYAPTITGMTPNSGPESGGTLVTLTGSGFDGASVNFGEKTAGIVERTDSRMVVRAPAGTGFTLVQAQYAGLKSNSQNWTWTKGTAAPQITAVSPNTGLEYLGTRVTLSGNNLDAASSVTFNGQAVAFTRSNGQLSFDAPGLARGTYPIVVTTSAGSATSSFTYTSWF